MKGKISDLNLKKIKIVIIVLVIVLMIWFLIANPLIKFKNAEKKVMDAAKRYYEINNRLLPTGTKIRTVSLQQLYDKDFISEDLRSPYTSKECDAKTSWAKVKKENNEYKYYVYLKCGILSSKVDHKGPVITLNKNEIVTINKGEKYKDPGVKSVIDDTDGNISPKKVIIDTSKVNTNKNGTYEVTYKVRDSFNNETVKIRTVKVEQILDKIVKKDTKNKKVYQGSNDKNYLKIDGILFKIVGLNDDGSVKVVSNDALAAVDYNGVNDWLNDYFYNKLSDSAKKYIKSDSKWCNEKISNPENYTKCNSYSKKSPVGLLSVADINNSKDGDESYNIEDISQMWTSNNTSKSNRLIYSSVNGFSKKKSSENIKVYPTINIIKDTSIISGSGYFDSPYVLKGNDKKLKVGNKISNAKSGEYIYYSGYNWRVIGKESDGTTKVIMDDIIKINNEEYSTEFTTKSKIRYNPKEKNNIGYKLNNEITSYIKTTLFDKKESSILNYKKTIGYNKEINKGTYSSKLHIPSMYDLFSVSGDALDYYFANYSSSSNTACMKNYQNNSYCGKFDSNYVGTVRIVAYLDKKVIVKGGNGLTESPYTLSK